METLAEAAHREADMNRARLRWFACSVLLGLWACLYPWPAPALAADPTVVVLQVDGIISPATSDFITRGLKQAADDGAMLAVIKLDTPGGLDPSMRSIVRQILPSPIPVARFVSPGGDLASTAGTFIISSSTHPAMNPAPTPGDPP